MAPLWHWLGTSSSFQTPSYQHSLPLGRTCAGSLSKRGRHNTVRIMGDNVSYLTPLSHSISGSIHDQLMDVLTRHLSLALLCELLRSLPLSLAIPLTFLFNLPLSHILLYMYTDDLKLGGASVVKCAQCSLSVPTL